MFLKKQTFRKRIECLRVKSTNRSNRIRIESARVRGSNLDEINNIVHYIFEKKTQNRKQNDELSD